MKLKVTFSVFFILTFLHLFSQENSYYHYFYSRKVADFTGTKIVNDTLECYYKKGIDSAQVIFLIDNSKLKSWYCCNDTVYYFANNLLTYSPEKYQAFLLKAGKMLFTPLLYNGISYKKNLNEGAMRTLTYDTLIDGKIYNCFNEATIVKSGNIDSVNRSVYFYKGLPVKLRFFALIKPLTLSYDVDVLAIDSNTALIKNVLDSSLVYMKEHAAKWERTIEKKESIAIDTLKIIRDFIQSENLGSDNRIIVIDLWYRGCAPCLRSIPSLNMLSGEDNINLIGLNMIDSNETEVRKFMEKFDVKYKLRFDLNSHLRKLNINAFPTVIVFNPVNNKFRFEPGFDQDDNLGKLKKLVDVVR